MTFLSKPDKDGLYRIKVLTQDLYIESRINNNSSIVLAPLSSAKEEQKWKLTAVAGKSNVWKITTANGQAGLTYFKTSETYWGYGYPLPKNGTASNDWSITERSSDGKTYSKITLSGSSDPFDSNNGDSAGTINFYYDKGNFSAAPKQCYVFEKVPSSTLLDLVICQDATGSQQPYIDKARSEVNQLVQLLVSNQVVEASNLRMKLVSFRDHPPEEPNFLVKEEPWTTDPAVLAQSLSVLKAEGGGDGPEAVADALSLALRADWRDEATKAVVLITDAPPHGIGEKVDHFENGCPLQNDPLQIADRMSNFGIVLDVVACEPSLSSDYKRARDFYVGLTGKTGGQVVPLGDVQHLVTLLGGTVAQTVALDKVARQVFVSFSAQQPSNRASAVSHVTSKCRAEGTHVHTLVHDDYYIDPKDAVDNAAVWKNATKLADAKPHIKPVSGYRIKDRHDAGAFNCSLQLKPISDDQIDKVVTMALARGPK